MTLPPPEDRDLIERVLGVSAFNAPHTMYSFEDVEALLAAVRAEAAPSSPGDGWVMVPKAIEDRERLLDEVFTVLEGFSCADLSSRAAYAKIVEIASLPAAPSPGGDHEA